MLVFLRELSGQAQDRSSLAHRRHGPFSTGTHFTFNWMHRTQACRLEGTFGCIAPLFVDRQPWLPGVMRLMIDVMEAGRRQICRGVGVGVRTGTGLSLRSRCQQTT